MKHGKFFKNAAVISLGVIAAKGIGALYRIPLTALLGGYGMGLYQMAYPLFVVLLTFSSTGIPSALARLIAEDRARGRGEGSLRRPLRMFAAVGLFGSLLMCLLAPVMSALQGDRALLPCYLALSPAVFLVSMIAVLRGYFQGRGEMAPTAFSEIVEQIVKAAAGLLLAGSFRDPALGAMAALFAVTVSEAVALLGLFMRYGRKRERLLTRERSGASVLSAALPVMAATGLLPLSHMADSVLIVRLLSRYTTRAVTLYGLLAGASATLSSLPATVCYGFVAALVPAVSGSMARGREEEGKRRALFALLLSLLLSVPLSAALILLARPAVLFLFPRLAEGDAETLILLVRLSSLSSVFLAGTETLSAALTGMGRAKRAAISMLAGILVKSVLQVLLIDGRLHIFGAAIAQSACVTVAFFMDLFYTVRKKKGKTYDHGNRIGNGAGRADPCRTEGAHGGGRGPRAHGSPRSADLEGRKYSL